MHACRRQCPGRSDGSCSLIPLHQRRPSPRSGRVGSCVMCFEAFSTFTHIATYMLTESLKRPFAPKAPAVLLPPPLLRLLPGETNQFPGGLSPTEKHRLSRRTAPRPLQTLHHYYRTIRHLQTHRYFAF